MTRNGFRTCGRIRCRSCLTRRRATSGELRVLCCVVRGNSNVSRKCLIISAYANANPQVAAEWSGKMSTWGESLPFLSSSRPVLFLLLSLYLSSSSSFSLCLHILVLFVSSYPLSSSIALVTSSPRLYPLSTPLPVPCTNSPRLRKHLHQPALLHRHAPQP
jgi:hypothetical protein